jgi:hypothetical protein
VISLHPFISSVVKDFVNFSFYRSDFMDSSVILTNPYTDNRFNLSRYFETPSTIDLSVKFKHHVRLKYFKFIKFFDISITESSEINLHPQKSKNSNF